MRGSYDVSRRQERYSRNEPELPENLDFKDLPRGVRAELKGLSPENATIVGQHLIMAGKLIEEDPELAFDHAYAAKERAPRLQVVREALGETAYAAGHYDVALTEFRAVRRMSGGNEYVAAMADSERALGRYSDALKLIKEGLLAADNAFDVIELRLVEAGVRADRGQLGEAARLLQSTIKTVGTRGSKLERARLRYGYADMLERLGDTEGAEKWFKTVVALDPEQETDAHQRLAALQGVELLEDEVFYDEYEEPEEEADAKDENAEDAQEPEDAELDASDPAETEAAEENPAEDVEQEEEPEGGPQA
ncbi:MAG: tetratricopeptide repeat protein [Propionibacteriaceae bacterium]|nr:tetratricopeptide repeat protein [Propionibacteriaceae bacterium]